MSVVMASSDTSSLEANQVTVDECGMKLQGSRLSQCLDVPTTEEVVSDEGKPSLSAVVDDRVVTTSTLEPSCPDVVPTDLDDILRSFGSKTGKRRSSSAFHCLCQTTTILSYDEEGMSSGTSSYNSGFSSSSDSSVEEKEDVPSGKPDDAVVASSADASSNVPYEAEDVDISTKENEELIIGSNLNKRKANTSKQRTRKLPVRSKRMGRGSVTYTNVTDTPAEAPSNFKKNLRSTTKSIAYFWKRKKPMEHGSVTTSEVLKVDARKDTCSEVSEPVVVPLDENQGQSIVSPVSLPPTPASAEENVCVKAVISNDRILVAAKKMLLQPEIEIYERKKPLVDIADQFFERFDCDTGEIVAEGGFKPFCEPIIRGFDCDSGELVTARDLSAAHILSHDLRNSSANEVAAALVTDAASANQQLYPAIEPTDPPLLRNSLERSDAGRDPMSPTSVIVNMELMFSDSDVKGLKNLLRDSVDSSVSSISTNSSLSLTRSSDGDEIRNPLSDENGSVAGSASLSDQHQARHLRSSKVFVRKPKSQPSANPMSSTLSVPYTLPLNMRGVVTHRSISILLLKPAQKVFEIVSVDVTRSTLLKDTLQAACVAASNPVLAQQTYISLCSDIKVLSNMTSPMSKLIVQNTSSGAENAVVTVNPEESDADMLSRREMERRLLVAVPERSDPTECQAIRRILWKNPKLQVWWNIHMSKSDGFVIMSEHDMCQQ